MSKVIINEGQDNERIVDGDSYGFHDKGMTIITKGKRRVFSIKTRQVETIEVKDI